MSNTDYSVEPKAYAPIDIQEGMRVTDIFRQLENTGDKYILIGDMLTMVESNGHETHFGRVKKISNEPITATGKMQKVVRNGKEYKG